MILMILGVKENRVIVKRRDCLKVTNSNFFFLLIVLCGFQITNKIDQNSRG